jgi:hypothetical protein
MESSEPLKQAWTLACTHVYACAITVNVSWNAETTYITLCNQYLYNYQILYSVALLS